MQTTANKGQYKAKSSATEFTPIEDKIDHIIM